MHWQSFLSCLVSCFGFLWLTEQEPYLPSLAVICFWGKAVTVTGIPHHRHPGCACCGHHLGSPSRLMLCDEGMDCCRCSYRSGAVVQQVNFLSALIKHWYLGDRLCN